MLHSRLRLSGSGPGGRENTLNPVKCRGCLIRQAKILSRVGVKGVSGLGVIGLGCRGNGTVDSSTISSQILLETLLGFGACVACVAEYKGVSDTL